MSLVNILIPMYAIRQVVFNQWTISVANQFPGVICIVKKRWCQKNDITIFRYFIHRCRLCARIPAHHFINQQHAFMMRWGHSMMQSLRMCQFIELTHHLSMHEKINAWPCAIHSFICNSYNKRFLKQKVQILSNVLLWPWCWFAN